MQFELSSEYIDRLQKAIESKDEHFIKASLASQHSVDITHILHQFNSKDSKYILGLLDTSIGAEIISNLEEDTRKRFLKEFTSAEITSYVVEIDSDDAADILQEEPIKIREEVLAYLKEKNSEKAEHIKELLRYEEDSAGGLMAKEFVKVNVNLNVKQCIDEIRRQSSNVEKIYAVYVVDDNDVLKGRVSLKRIVLTDDDTQLEDIYNSEIVLVKTFMDEQEVASIMQKYDLDAVPVVDVQGKLQGRITIDDIVDVITEQAEIDKQLMSGISESIEESSSVMQLVKAKLPWLIVGVVGGLLGAYIMGFFEKDLVMIPAVAFFIPLITATGGNVGIQSSSLVVQSLASLNALNEKLSTKLLKVFMVAILNGLVMSIIVFSFNLVSGDTTNLAFVVSISLFAVVLLASFMGTITPLVLDKLNINPALASGPFITTANDILGLAVYFTVAHFLI